MGPVHQLLSQKPAAGNRASNIDDPARLDLALQQNQALVETLEAELDTRAEILNQTVMVTITAPDGTIIYANDLFCSISGFARHHVIGRTHDIIRHTDVSDETISTLWKIIRMGNMWKGEMKSLRRDKSIFWTQTTVAPVLNEQGEPLRYIWVRYDITDLKETQVRLREARQRADQQLLDNVEYASSIQQAMFPGEETLRELFPASFMISSPKHAVSGDFHWFRRIGDESVVVLGDGTGHGVSASYISLMALTSLKYAVDEMRITEPGVVLSRINSFLFRAMNKHEGSGLCESVDMAFCNYNHKTRVLRYASGNSKIFLARNGELKELGRDHASIGATGGNGDPISSRSLVLERGDRIFLMSDGFADQLGGDRDRRFGSRHLRELLQFTSQSEMQVQKEVIHKNHLLWRGTNEQTDDITMVAFSVE